MRYYNVVKRRCIDSSYVKIVKTFLDNDKALEYCGFRNKFAFTKKYYYVTEIDFE